MNATRDFNSLKRKVYFAYHQDGILDLVAGAAVAGFGLNMLTGNIAFLMFGWMVLMFYVLFKQRITIPRFGYVSFEPKEKTVRQGWILLGIGVVILLGIFAAPMIFDSNPTSQEIQALLKQYHMVPLSALLFGLPCLLAAVLLGLKRFYLYLLILLALPALGAWMNIDTYIPILVSGLVMLVFGAGLLTSFLRKYPLEDKADSDDGG